MTVSNHKSARGAAFDCCVASAISASLLDQPLELDNGALGLPLPLFHLARIVSKNVPGFGLRFLLALREHEDRDLAPIWPRCAIRILREIALPAVTVDKWGVRDAIIQVCVALKTGKGLKAAAAAAAYAAHAAGGAHADAANAAAYAANAAAAAANAAAAAAAAHAAANAVPCEAVPCEDAMVAALEGVLSIGRPADFIAPDRIEAANRSFEMARIG